MVIRRANRRVVICRLWSAKLTKVCHCRVSLFVHVAKNGLQMNSATPSTVNARRLTLATGTGSFQEDSLDVTHEQSEAQSAMQIPLHVPRRKWWGSREDRVIQLWPTGRPWESIVKEKASPCRKLQVFMAFVQVMRRLLLPDK